MTRWGISTYNIHKYKRYGRGFSLPLSDNPAGFDAIALQFQLNQVVAFSDFVALYDQYKITYIQCKISWSPKQSLPVSVNEPAQSSYPLLYSYKDYDDSQTPLNLAEMKERGNLIQTRLNPNKIISIGLKPATLNATYSTPLLTVSNPKWGSIIDVGAPQVPYFGLKLGIDHLPSFSQGTIEIETIYFMTFYGAK